MPKSRDFPPGANNAVLAQITSIFDAYGRLGAAPGSVSALAPIEVWFLGADATLQPTKDLRQLAIRTVDWLHVLTTTGVATGHAVSRPGGPTPQEWKVVSFTASATSQRIVDVMKWLNANGPPDAEVRFLAVPAFHLTAFWLIEAAYTYQSVTIIDCLPELSSLKGRFLSSDSFVDALRSARVSFGIAS